MPIGKTLPSTRLNNGRTLLLEGPASVRLEDGEATILGASLSNDWVVVREDRQVPIETPTEAGLEFRLGQGGKFKLVPESTVPTGWKEASQIILQSPGTIVILGDVDSGKSTLCTFLANNCNRQGVKVRVIDGDVGQADIGPPTTISAANITRQIFSLQDLTPEISLFMGDTSPSSTMEKIWLGLVQLRKKFADNSDVLLVNTDGWVQGDDALRYKAQLLESLQPDLVLGISSNGELDALLGVQNATALKLSRSTYARTRTKEERKKAREYGYKRFFQNSRRVELRLRDVKVRRFDSSYHQLRLDVNENLRGVLAGLLDEDETLISIGRVERLENGLLSLTSQTVESPRIVELGAVVLSPSFEEVGFGP